MNNFKGFVHRWAWLLLIAFCVIGLIYPIIGVAAIICMLSPSIFALFRSRKWCSSYCPRGSFNDNILSKISLKKKIPPFMKRTWFKNLILFLLLGAFALQITFAWGSLAAVGMVFVRMIIITTSITIILGVIYNQRTWCVICPMGTLGSYVGKLVNNDPKTKNVPCTKETCANCKREL